MEIETEQEIGDLLNESKSEEIHENLTVEEEEATANEDMEGELSVNDNLKLITSDDESKLDDSFDDGTVEEEIVLIKEENLLSPRGFKRKPEDELSSDEEFAGFDDADNNSPSKNHRSKKLKENIIAEFENRNESVVQLKEKKVHSRPVPLTDPIFLEPFKYGWKREMVLRATPGVSKEKGEIYYITPTGKRLRTRNEIALNLHDDLTLTNFTLIKEALGADPDFEIIRSAKNINSKRNSIEPVNSNLTPVIGKRIPKPKAPKGVSPPPYKSGKINRMLNTPVSRKDVENEVKTIGLGGKPGKGTKPKPDNCTIQCLLAMGTIPQLQCKKCLCLYHHECVGFDRLDGPIANYICEGCIEELALLHVQQTLPPQPLLPPVPDVPAPITSRPSITAATKPENPPVQLHQPREGNVVGSMTTWLPPTSNISTNRSGLNKIENPPQTIAVLKGRKFIVVPKMNLLSVSPLGETKNNVERGAGGRMKLLLSDGGHHKTGSDDRNHEASQLTPSTNSQLNTVEPITMTGKRTKSRGNSIGASPVTSPPHNSETSPNLTHNNSKISTNNFNSTGKNKKGVSTVLCNHVNFSANFFSNVSVGYDVLLQTFQLLNVQELLRASCVCRMWNQVANHSTLWKTVRMKNSLVNDWSGLASTLKRNGTKNLDLRKMLTSGKPEEMWSSFRNSIGSVVDLESIDFCKCSASVIESLFQTNFNLKVLNAVTLTDEDLNLTNLSNLSKLTELRLKSSNANGLFIKDLSDLEDLRELRHLSLTGVVDIGQKNIKVLAGFKNLESLELGECSDLPKSFADLLSSLNKLERLRLEKGQVDCCTFEILTQIAKMENLHQLELINFDINNGFNTYLSKCKFLKKILLIPTYVSQSATTNQMVLSSVLPLSENLTLFTWVVTLELLRVTELYVDKCDGSKKDKNPLSDCIPILKPVPGNMEISQRSDLSKKSATEQQVEILPLQKVEQILTDGLPNTKVQMLRISYNSTWKQNLVDSSQ